MSAPEATIIAFPLRFVVALAVEGLPLIERYRLEPEGHAGKPYRVFRRGEVALVVSGIGKIAAAAATSFLHRATGEEPDAVWLNVGIAGHGSRAVGEPVLAHKIVDRESGRAWYPPLVFPPPCATDQVTTVDRPETGYAEPGAYEMEASGFCPQARRLSSAELVHCLKIVSDGPNAAVEQLDARSVRRLVAEAVPTVEAVAAACGALSLELRVLDADPAELRECLDRWHFTVSERHELRRQLRRRQALAADRPLPLEDLARSTRGKEVNRCLRDWLDSVAVS